MITLSAGDGPGDGEGDGEGEGEGEGEGVGVGLDDAQPEVEFWGSLGVMSWKSLVLLSVSVLLPSAPPGFRS